MRRGARRSLGRGTHAERLWRAVAQMIGEAKSVTYDLKPVRDDPSAVGTREMAEAIIAAM